MHGGSVCLSELITFCDKRCSNALGGEKNPKNKKTHLFLVDEAGSGSRVISNPDAAGKISLQKCFIYSGLNNKAQSFSFRVTFFTGLH